MSILLENVSKRYGQQTVVNNVSLEIQDGEFFVLLGSSGSGKTTILNIIAGLTSADEGRVLLHDRDVTDLPTQKRNVGFVFQNYALFEYMTIAENIEFGLQIRKIPKKQRQAKRDELLELVGLVGLSERMPRSPGRSFSSDWNCASCTWLLATFARTVPRPRSSTGCW